jgi:hypothetical protein
VRFRYSQINRKYLNFLFKLGNLKILFLSNQNSLFFKLFLGMYFSVLLRILERYLPSVNQERFILNSHFTRIVKFSIIVSGVHLIYPQNRR